MYLGRYGRQDAATLQERVPMRTVISWANRIDEMLERENESKKG